MKEKIISFSVIIIALALCVIPFYNTVVNGIYNWHIQQPEVWQGGLELLLFSCIVILTSLKMKDKFVHILFFLSAIYLSLSGVLLPAVIAMLYLECIFLIGFAFGTAKKQNDYLQNFIVGTAVFLCCVLGGSFVGHGTINDTRIIILVLIFVSIILNHNKDYVCFSKSVCCYLKSNANSKKFITIVTLSVFFVLMLFAKTNSALDYDSLWYGLRPEIVLVGEKSVFEYLGLSSFVFYYPKLMEIFFLPISGMGDYSFIISGNICLLIFTAYVIYRIMSKLCFKLEKWCIHLTILAVISIPSIGNIAATAKADMLGFLFVAIAFYYFIEYVQIYNMNAFIMLLCSLFMSTGTKLTYLLWGGILFLAAIVCFGAYAIGNRKSINVHLTKKQWMAGLLSLIGVIGVHFRTFYLTGYPIYPTGLNLFNKLGFTAKNLLISDRTGTTMPNNTEWIKRTYQIIFDNSDLEHMIMQWPSNIVLALLIFVFLNKCINKINKQNRSILVVCVIEAVVAIYYLLSMNLPDSNYFNFPICMSIIVAIYIICEKDNKKVFFARDLTCILCVFIAFQSVFSLTTHFSWKYGTHKIDFEIVKDNFETEDNNDIILTQCGIGSINQYLEKENIKNIICTYNDYRITGRISARVQNIDDIDCFYSNTQISSSYEGFLDYVEYGKVEGFIIFNDYQGWLNEYIERMIGEKGIKHKIQDNAATYYEFDI